MKKVNFSILFGVVLLCTLAIYTNAFAQEEPDVKDSLYSEVLQEQRTYHVTLPKSYDPASEVKYDVVYLTDGEWAENLFTFVHKFALDEQFVPDMIMVTVPNRYENGKNQRDRDFLPVNAPQPPISGGADNFIKFLETELMPLIDKKYPNSGVNALYGHSYGGVFTMYTLLAKPDLFDMYLATDPPYSWYNGYLINLAAEKLPNLPDNKLLWIAGITETYKGMGIDKMDSVLKEKAPAGLHYKVVTFPNEKHNSVRFKAMYDGIKFAYSGFSNQSLKFHPMGGVVLPDSAYGVFIENPTEVRYTTDGSVPTMDSQKSNQFIPLMGPVKLSVKSFSASGRYDAMTTGSFEIGEVLPAIAKPKKVVAGGLSYAAYEGDFSQLPDFSKLKSTKTGVADKTFTLEAVGDSAFACKFDGYLEIVKPGYYIFAFEVDDAVRLTLGDKVILNSNSVKESAEVTSYMLPLKTGFYPVSVEYFQKNGGKSLNFYYVLPGTMNATMFPLEQMYHK